MLKKNHKNLILDRSFISELVFGPVLRNSCKINENETKNIIAKYAEVLTKIIYLKADKLTLLQRRRDDEEDTQMLKTYYEELNSRYEKVIRILARYMPILTLDTSKLSQNDIAKSATKFVFDELER